VADILARAKLWGGEAIAGAVSGGTLRAKATLDSERLQFVSVFSVVRHGEELDAGAILAGGNQCQFPDCESQLTWQTAKQVEFRHLVTDGMICENKKR
jgi:hypothetical protein